ncbi:response regulator receiver protein CheY-like [Rubrivivax gelatinosus IL144]|uniref:Response regulator receiver protein CheY-like n=1 Tax=Rubrivivax gelatinosus (strain NBRC 100245 / IL144) TaxID=983917 RepID=I0HPZ3_RUBGI|nr:response regulator receiver protein CheY-like [Rubrivivax gelatinosus IL144]
MASKGRILVVDDDRLVLAAVTHGLAQAGYEVVDADNGDEAILKARQLRPEIALLDIRMEGKSGFDVAEYLRDVARIPFMFLSAFADEATIAKVHELGAVAYLIKPLDIDQILPTVDEAFARLRAGDLAPQPAAQPASAPVAAPVAEPLSDPLPLAVGVLMHRHSLTRAAARQRLQRMAAEQGISEAAQAERLVAAVEELARSA